jgi:hypothetical protein
MPFPSNFNLIVTVTIIESSEKENLNNSEDIQNKVIAAIFGKYFFSHADILKKLVCPVLTLK